MRTEPAPHIYLPSDPDPLRDGLFKGFWAHLKPAPEKKP